MTFEIQVMTWYRHYNVAGLNRFIGSHAAQSNNDNTDTITQYMYGF